MTTTTFHMDYEAEARRINTNHNHLFDQELETWPNRRSGGEQIFEIWTGKHGPPWLRHARKPSDSFAWQSREYLHDEINWDIGI